MFYFIDYSEGASDLTVMSPLLLSALPDFLWSPRVWRDDSLVGGGVFFFSSFNSLTDISACIFGHLPLMTAVCPVQGRRRRFWFWWRAADCRVGAVTLLPQSRLCVDWEARLSLEKNVTVKVKVPELKNHIGDLILEVCKHQRIRWNKNRRKQNCYKSPKTYISWREQLVRKVGVYLCWP